MVKQFAGIITSFLLNENIIEQNDKEIYKFGTEQILKYFIVLVVLSILATIFKLWLVTIFISIGFIPLRLIAGGYHAKTLLRCNLLTFSVYAINMLIINFVINVMTYQIFIIICLLSVLLIFLFAPVDHKNMVFSAERMLKARKNSRVFIMTLVLFLMSLVYISGDIDIVPISMIMGAFTASISIFIGNLKRRRERDEN